VLTDRSRRTRNKYFETETYNNINTVASHNPQPSSLISLSQVTPELAAQIVKHFVLPMFETSGKKELRIKKRVSSQINVGSQRQSTTFNSDSNSIKQLKFDKLDQSQTVFGGLKLTESLFDELKRVKTLFDSKLEDLERVEAEKGILTQQFKLIKTKYKL
jgi:hypothetical protein